MTAPTTSSWTPSPYGMETCMVCDAPTTHVGVENGTAYPYCATCAAEVEARFPKTEILEVGAKT